MTDPTPHFHRFGLAPDRVVILLPAQTVNPAACWRSRGRLAHSLRIEAERRGGCLADLRLRIAQGLDQRRRGGLGRGAQPAQPLGRGSGGPPESGRPAPRSMVSRPAHQSTPGPRPPRGGCGRCRRPGPFPTPAAPPSPPAPASGRPPGARRRRRGPARRSRPPRPRLPRRPGPRRRPPDRAQRPFHREAARPGPAGPWDAFRSSTGPARRRRGRRYPDRPGRGPGQRRCLCPRRQVSQGLGRISPHRDERGGERLGQSGRGSFGRRSDAAQGPGRPARTYSCSGRLASTLPSGPTASAAAGPNSPRA